MNKNLFECTASLIDAINAAISTNRCSFSTEDLVLLQDCILMLKELENDSFGFYEDRCKAFVEVVVKLDRFLCSGKYLQDFYDVFG